MRLLTLSRDTDGRLRQAAAAALGPLGASAAPALDRLLELIRDEDLFVRLEAARALSGLGASAAPALDRLLELIRDEDCWAVLREAAARALGRIMARGVRIFKLPGWKRLFRGNRVARLEDLDPEQPATS